MVFGANLNTPNGWLLGFGQAATRAGLTAGLFAAITKSLAVTLSIASPGVVNWTAHGLVVGSRVSMETTGTLPTGLNTATDYYVLNPSTNSFNVGTPFVANIALTGISWSGGQVTATTASAHGLLPGSLFTINGCTPAGYNGVYVALGGTAGSTLVAALASNPGGASVVGQLANGISIVPFTGSQSGVQTCRFNPFGCGDGTTTFNVPDGRDSVLAGWGAMGGTDRGLLGGNYSAGGFLTSAMGNFAGEQAHLQTMVELAIHNHTYNGAAPAATQPNQGGGAAYSPAGTGNAGGNSLMNNTQNTLLMNLFVKL
jgi:microcystin-dependent protein